MTEATTIRDEVLVGVREASDDHFYGAWKGGGKGAGGRPTTGGEAKAEAKAPKVFTREPKTAADIYGTVPKGVPVKTHTFYHTTRTKYADSILTNGPTLDRVNPRWRNDYAVSATKSEKGARGWFTGARQDPMTTPLKDRVVMKMEMKGRVLRVGAYHGAEETIPGLKFADGHYDYTRQVMKAGYDAVDLNGTVYIYNPKAISRVEAVGPEAANL